MCACGRLSRRRERYRSNSRAVVRVGADACSCEGARSGDGEGGCSGACIGARTDVCSAALSIAGSSSGLPRTQAGTSPFRAAMRASCAALEMSIEGSSCAPLSTRSANVRARAAMAESCATASAPRNASRSSDSRNRAECRPDSGSEGSMSRYPYGVCSVCCSFARASGSVAGAASWASPLWADETGPVLAAECPADEPPESAALWPASVPDATGAESALAALVGATSDGALPRPCATCSSPPGRMAGGILGGGQLLPDSSTASMASASLRSPRRRSSAMSTRIVAIAMLYPYTA